MHIVENIDLLIYDYVKQTMQKRSSNNIRVCQPNQSATSRVIRKRLSLSDIILLAMIQKQVQNKISSHLKA